MMPYQALIIEDDSNTSLFLQHTLRVTGINLTLAEDGAQAIALLEGMQPDIIFLDLLLPKVNGIDVLRYIMAQPRLKDTFVAVISTRSDRLRPIPELERANVYFVKPVRPLEIQQLVRKLLNERNHQS